MGSNHQAISTFREEWEVSYELEEVIQAVARDPDTNLENFTDLMSSDPAVTIETEREIFSPDGEADPSPASLVTGRAVYIRVDVTHPVDMLLPLIEGELRSFVKVQGDRLAGEPELRRTLAKVSGRRPRLDQVDPQLRVYDLAAEGQTFRAIATEVSRPLSTVKSAFLTARRNIFGKVESFKKKTLPLAAFDPNRHAGSCSVCSKAEVFEDMCPKARLYAGQDEASRRELPIDPTELRRPDES